MLMQGVPGNLHARGLLQLCASHVLQPHDTIPNK